MDKPDFLIECQCGKIWNMDYQPTPSGCENDSWRVGVIEWGIWVDPDGSPTKEEYPDG